MAIPPDHDRSDAATVVDGANAIDEDLAVPVVEGRVNSDRNDVPLDLGLAVPEPVTIETLTSGPLMPDLDTLIALTRRAIERSQRLVQSDPVAVMFADLADSTLMKRLRGNHEGALVAQTFSEVVGEVVRRWNGEIVKPLGDAVMATFANPVHACHAALNIRNAADRLDIEVRVGLAHGTPVRGKILGFDDVIGTVVDRAARVQSMAIKGQVLIDDTLYAHAAPFLIEDVVVGQGRRVAGKGTGEFVVHEIALRNHWALAGHLATPFEIKVDGRPGPVEKAALIANAEKEIIEIGIGLTSFANYFTGEKESDFSDPFHQAVRRGVNLKCFALDFDYKPGADWVDEQGDSNYPAAARRAHASIMEQGAIAKNGNHARGRIHYFTYRRVPEFWCLGVDVDDPVNGRMFYAPYLMGTTRANNPVIQISALSHPEYYAKLLKTVHAVRAASTEPRLA